MEHKICTKCKDEKPITDFYPYGGKCKSCTREIASDNYRKRNIDKVRKYGSISDISEETKQKIREEIDMGVKYCVIAKRYGIKAPTFYYWKKIGIFD